MKAIVLAAGRGSRMGDGTAEIPKGMMRLWGRPLLEMCVKTLERAGFARCDIGVVTGYRSDRINLEGVRLFHNADWAHTNMFVSLTKAREWLRAEPCVICYSDIVFHENAVRGLMDCGRELAIT